MMARRAITLLLLLALSAQLAFCRELRRPQRSVPRQAAGFGDLDSLLKAVSSGKLDIEGITPKGKKQIPAQQPELQQPPQVPNNAPDTRPAAPQPVPIVNQPRGSLACSHQYQYAAPPRGQPAAPLKLVDGKFIADRKQVNLHGVNWFGFNAHATYLHGLWAGQASANSDFAAIAWQFRLLGFNAIRLPFLFADLWTPAEMIGGYCTHESTLQELAQRTVDPEYRGTISKSPPTPPVALPDVSKAGSCNTYIPPTPGNKALAIDRYLWTVQWFIANGFYVVIDWHPMGMEQTSYVVDDFVREWKKVWEAVACLPNFESDLKGRLLVDLANEPDSQWQGWQVKNGKAGFTDLYLGAMDAIWSMTPDAPIFVVEGAGQGAYAGLNWGNGFVTDNDIIKEFGIHDANPFFTTLLTKPYLNNVVISPHLYGPSVSNRKDWYKGRDWMESLDKAFGYFSQAPGYCANGKCHMFPIAVGEFGSRFTNPEDLAHLSDLALYMNAQGAGNTGGHNAFSNWFYWSYNANSGDTGGLVDDSWMKFEWVKLRYLQQNLGLTPWYK